MTTENGYESGHRGLFYFFEVLQRIENLWYMHNPSPLKPTEYFFFKGVVVRSLEKPSPNDRFQGLGVEKCHMR